DGDYRTAYEALHEQLYGYRREGRPIEIVAARVEVVGRTPEPPVGEEPPRPRRPQPSEMVSAFFDGAHRLTSLFHRRDLHAGDDLIGPAIVCEPTSTVVIEPGFTATVTSRGEILIDDTAAAMQSRQVATRRRTGATRGREVDDT